MTQSKQTKKALLASMLSLVLCFTMLIGSTFAWFTDSATTSVNKIVAGNLDVELEYATKFDTDGKVTEWTKVDENTKLFSDVETDGTTKNLWEPGHTEVVYLKISNVGSLALKYQFAVTVANEVTSTNVDGDTLKLSDHLVFGQIEDVQAKYATREAAQAAVGEVKGLSDYTKAGSLEVGEDSVDYIALVVYMPTTVGNEANYRGETAPSIDLGVSLVATQDTVESDSFDNQYDKNAWYKTVGYEVKEAATQDDLNEIIKDATDKTAVELPTGNYTLPEMKNKDVVFTGDKNAVIDATQTIPSTNNANITFDGVTVKFANGENYKGFQHSEKVVYKNATIVGQQTLYAPEVEFINCTFEVDETGYNVWTYGAKNVTFTDCTFNTGGRAILVYNEMTADSFVANITLNNCTFNDDGTYTDAKAAVETGSNANNTETSNKYNLTFNNCKTQGFEQNSSTSPLWGNKNDMDQDHLNVVIDGADVY